MPLLYRPTEYKTRGRQGARVVKEDSNESCEEFARRSARVLLAFAIVFLLNVFFVFDVFEAPWYEELVISRDDRPAVGQGSESSGSIAAATKIDGAPPHRLPPKVKIFYNLFTAREEDEERVKKIVEEQFAHIDPELHNATHVSTISIGHRLPVLPQGAVIEHHYEAGGEEQTLRNLWEYCKANPHFNTKVAYLHSKGSYHPMPQNEKLREFLTSGALSTECANLPNSCNVCSSRMSPLPHPHTPGNMWLARCSYISKVFDPMSLSEGKLPDYMREDNACKGRGRYLMEHWVHSHPSVRPCDLYPGKFTWAYNFIPDRNWNRELHAAPRFKFDKYAYSWACLDDGPKPEDMQISKFVEVRLKTYEVLYGVIGLEKDWWGWNFIRRSIL